MHYLLGKNYEIKLCEKLRNESKIIRDLGPFLSTRSARIVFFFKFQLKFAHELPVKFALSITILSK